ncbi:MAG TPA: hypothetical protein VGD10_10190 [Allosphingosinicella sp.]|uniref:hypothetical protein n=1 Tax=Allosphingosinicella sp. TaxID=2823234 RepID=UPI002ED941FC
MLRRFAVVLGMLALAACDGAGEGEEAGGNAAAPVADAPAQNDADLAADAALADAAAQAEAADAAVGGNMTSEDVSAANEQAAR